MPSKKPTIKEIAELANVSPATVSLVLNNKKGISEQTRRKILHILETTQYISPRAPIYKSLSFMFLKYKEHGMIVEENTGFIPAIIDYIEYFCAQRSIQLITKVLDKVSFEKFLSSSEIYDADGFFVLGTELTDEQISVLQKIDIPILLIDNSCRKFQLNSVVMSNEDIVHQAVEYLHTLNYRRIGYLCSNVEISNFKERRNGFYRSLKEFDLQMSCLFLMKPTLRGSYSDTKQQLQNVKSLPPAFFADNDTIALGAIKAFVEAGYKVPEDISIIGVDDIPFSAVAAPALTTIRVSRRAMAELSVTTLLQCVEAYQSEEVFPAIKVLIGGQLVERDSTRPFTGCPDF